MGELQSNEVCSTVKLMWELEVEMDQRETLRFEGIILPVKTFYTFYINPYSEMGKVSLRIRVLF